MAKVIISFQGSTFEIKCNKEDKMKNIFKIFANIVGVHLESLYFLYGGKTVNIDSKFQEIINLFDRIRNTMSVIAIEKERNYTFLCPYCGSNINSYSSLIHHLLIFNEDVVNRLYEIKQQIQNINYKNDIIQQIKNLDSLLNNLIQEFKKKNFSNKEKIKNINKNNSIKNIIEVKANNINNYNTEIEKIVLYNSFEDITVLNDDEIIKPILGSNQENLYDIKNHYKLVFNSSIFRFTGFFQGCQLIYIDLSKFDSSNINNMSYMFSNCNCLREIKLSNKFKTAQVINMSYMFFGCVYLAYVDLSCFDTSKVTNMSNMFYNCSNLRTLNLSNFDTSKVTNMSNMFYNCSN